MHEKSDVLSLEGGVGVRRHEAGQGTPGRFAKETGVCILRHQRFHHIEYRVVQSHIDHLTLPRRAVLAGFSIPATTRHIPMAQCRDIATVKMAYLNANDLDAARLIIAGTARSMGITVNG